MAPTACEAVYLPVFPPVAVVQHIGASPIYLRARSELPLIKCTLDSHPITAMHQLLQPDPSCCSHKFTSGQPPRLPAMLCTTTEMDVIQVNNEGV